MNVDNSRFKVLIEFFFSPMDVLRRSHRFSYAAAFGTLARLCAGIVFDAEYAFKYNGPTYLKGCFLNDSLVYS